MEALIALALISILFATLAFILIIKNLIYLCGPNEILVFIGRSRLDPATRRELGYRLKKGGRGVRVPLLERVARMDVSNITINVEITNAFSRGGIPLNVQGVANLKVAGEEPLIGRALERFLGKTRDEIIRVAKQTLEGNLRGVMARLTPEQVNEDKNAFAEKLVEEADDDLKKMGLTLDTLKIQNVTDDVGYLESIGRKRGAELQMKARIAEAKAKAEATIKEAENLRLTELTQIDAAIEISKAEAARRIAEAQTRKEALIAEERGQVAALIARSEADVLVQQARQEQVRLKLEADTLRPAHASKSEMENAARGRAAKVVADGNATVHALEDYIDAWKGGTNARDVVMMQKMRGLSEAISSTIGDVHVARIAVVDSTSGGLSGDIPKVVVDIASRLKAALGPQGTSVLTAGAPTVRN